MNRCVSAGIKGDKCCHVARMSGVLSMSSNVAAAATLEGGSTSSTA